MIPFVPAPIGRFEFHAKNEQPRRDQRVKCSFGEAASESKLFRCHRLELFLAFDCFRGVPAVAALQTIRTGFRFRDPVVFQGRIGRA